MTSFLTVLEGSGESGYLKIWFSQWFHSKNRERTGENDRLLMTRLERRIKRGTIRFFALGIGKKHVGKTFFEILNFFWNFFRKKYHFSRKNLKFNVNMDDNLSTVTLNFRKISKNFASKARFLASQNFGTWCIDISENSTKEWV